MKWVRWRALNSLLRLLRALARHGVGQKESFEFFASSVEGLELGMEWVRRRALNSLLRLLRA